MTGFIEKLKIHQDNLFFMAVIIMVGLVGFGLGRLSARYQPAELKIQSTLVNMAELDRVVTASPEKPIAEKTASPSAASREEALLDLDTVDVANKKIVGNKNSKIYHYEDCPGELKMKEGNKIFFASIIEAQKAGYRPAGNCPGLE